MSYNLNRVLKEYIRLLISLLLIFAVIISSTACGSDKRSGYDRLHDYIVENGGKWTDSYLLIHMNLDGSFTMTVDKNDNIYWSLSEEDDSSETYAEMQLYKDSVVQEIQMTHTYKGRTYKMSGKIMSSSFSYDSPDVYAYQSTLPTYMTETGEQLLEAYVNLMFRYATEVLKDSGIHMAELGFESYPDYIE